MSLDFEDTNRLVDVGSAAVIDNVEAGTLAAWVRLSGSAATIQSVYCKDVAFTTNGLRALWADVTNADVEFFQDRATTDLNVRTSSGLATGVWRFVAATWNTAGADGDQHIYWGGQTIPLNEFGYAVRQVGTGAVTSDAGNSGIIGNAGGGSRQFRGQIAWVGKWNRQLSRAQLEELRKELCVTPGCILFMHLGHESDVTRQLDWSGWHNHGTPTSSPVRRAHPDFLRPTRGWRKLEPLSLFVPDAGGGFQDGAGSSSLTFSPSGVGSSLADAAASSSLTFSPTAAGSSLADASASSSITFSPAAVGAALADAVASSSITFATAAVGAPLFDAAGSSSLTFTVAGVYGNEVDGTGSSTLTFAASAVGNSLFDGVGTSSLTFSGSAFGSSLASSAGTSTLIFTVAGAGESAGGLSSIGDVILRLDDNPESFLVWTLLQ